MKKHDDYISGPHHFGFISGVGRWLAACLALVAVNVFESTVLILVGAVVTAFIVLLLRAMGRVHMGRSLSDYLGS
jgi:hypothetical protein